MGAYDPAGRLVWSLSNSGLGTTIPTGSGNSGNWSNLQPNQMSPVDLRRVTDVTLYVVCTGITGSPSLVVKLNVFDDVGNPITVITTTAVTAANSPQFSSVGQKGFSATTYLALPEWGQVSWTLSGAAASTTGTEITLYGR